MLACKPVTASAAFSVCGPRLSVLFKRPCEALTSTVYWTLGTAGTMYELYLRIERSTHMGNEFEMHKCGARVIDT